MSTIVCVIAGLIFLGIMVGFYIINNEPHTPSWDEEENNPYDVPGPKGRMIDKFGY